MERKKLLVISILLLFTFNILAALNLGPIPVSAADYPAVYVDPPSTIDTGLIPGSTYVVSIKTDYNGSDITAWQFTLSFNPTVLNGIDQANGDLIDEGMFFFNPGTFDNTAGTLSLVGAFFFTAGDVAPGPGTLATVTFEVVGTGESNITIGKETQLIGWDASAVPPTDYYIVNAITMPDHIGHGYFSNAPPAVEYDLTIAVEGSGSTVPAVGVHTYPED
ncbi:MAG: cohesin domain-containing protein, partial [Candidatus Bathyarchaeota archaeon]